MRDSLLWRLLGTHLLVIAIAVVISGALITNLTALVFMEIMVRYHAADGVHVPARIQPPGHVRA